MKNGIIFNITRFIIENLKRINLVEVFKIAFVKLNKNPNNTAQSKQLERLGTDVFIILKWLTVLCFIFLGLYSTLCVLIIWYLIITNLYTYFFYHIWDENAINNKPVDVHSARRRFINLILAISYSNLCFAYFYFLPYSQEITWVHNRQFWQSFWFSVSNSLAANYSTISTKSYIGDNIAMIQLLITFFFVTIVLSKSIPEITED